MIRKHKKAVILTSLLTLAPLFAGLILWNRLPDRIATHFGFDGTPNGWSGKTFTVFGLPLFLLATHFVCAFFTALDPKGKNISDKVYLIILWLVPLVSLICGYVIYSNALDFPDFLGAGRSMFLLIGILLIVLGNYLPKSGQNYTVGIKLPWTLADESNWKKTHRLAGWIFMACGLLCLLNVFFQWKWVLAAVLLATLLIPTAYSFALYWKGKK